MPAAALRRVGGHPVLDFVNTVDPDLPIPETLHDFGDLVSWGEAGGIVQPEEAVRLRRFARDEGAARAALEETVALREALRDLLEAKLAEKTPPSAPIEFLNRLLHDVGPAAELQWSGHGFVRRAADPGTELRRPGRRLARLAADFLTSPDLGLLSSCEAGCGWLFLDRSASRRRRWCSMAGCGNRQKAQRFYRQRRNAAA